MDGATSFAKFCEEHDISPATGYREIKAGRLIARKVRGKTIVTNDDKRNWLQSLPVVGGDNNEKSNT